MAGGGWRHELLRGEIFYPPLGYTGYGDDIGDDLDDFVTDEMRLDWEVNRDALLEFWASGQQALVFPDSKSWLFARDERATAVDCFTV